MEFTPVPAQPVGRGRRWVGLPHKPPHWRLKGRWILWKLAQHVRDRGWWPSAPEIAAKLVTGSNSTVRRRLDALEKLGLVELAYRQWRLTDAGWREIGRLAIAPRYGRRPRDFTRKELAAAKAAHRKVLRRDAHRLLDTPTVSMPWEEPCH